MWCVSAVYVQHLFPGGAATTRRLRLELQERVQQVEGLILCVRDIGVVMQDEDIARVIDGQTLYVRHVALETQLLTQCLFIL